MWDVCTVISQALSSKNKPSRYFVGFESSRKHNNYVFGKNKEREGSLKLLFIFLLFIARREEADIDTLRSNVKSSLT